MDAGSEPSAPYTTVVASQDRGTAQEARQSNDFVQPYP